MEPASTASLRNASFAAAALGFASVPPLVLAGEDAATFAFLAGGAANAVAAALEGALPRAARRGPEDRACAWAGWVAWQAGAVACVLALAGLAPRQAGLFGGLALLVGAALALESLGLTLWRAGLLRSGAFLRASPYVALAAILAPLGALLVALSFAPGAMPETRRMGLGLLAAALVPAAVCARGLSLVRNP